MTKVRHEMEIGKYFDMCENIKKPAATSASPNACVYLGSKRRDHTHEVLKSWTKGLGQEPSNYHRM